MTKLHMATHHTNWDRSDPDASHTHTRSLSATKRLFKSLDCLLGPSSTPQGFGWFVTDGKGGVFLRPTKPAVPPLMGFRWPLRAWHPHSLTPPVTEVLLGHPVPPPGGRLPSPEPARVPSIDYPPGKLAGSLVPSNVSPWADRKLPESPFGDAGLQALSGYSCTFSSLLATIGHFWPF